MQKFEFPLYFHQLIVLPISENGFNGAEKHVKNQFYPSQNGCNFSKDVMIFTPYTLWLKGNYISQFVKKVCKKRFKTNARMFDAHF